MQKSNEIRQFILFENNQFFCLSMISIILDENNFQLSIYIYGHDNQTIITSSESISYSNWFHVAVISSRNSFSLYVNGILVASFIDTNGNATQTNSQQRLTLTIGNPETRSNQHNLNSSLCITDENRSQISQIVIGVDNLQFYSRELKVKEIQAMINDDFSPTKYFFS